MAETLDAIDIRILEQIQKDNSLSTAQLAERVGLSQSHCWRRVQRLKDEGFVKAEVALLDRMRFEPSLIIFAQLKMATLSEIERAAFIRAVENAPEIVECHTMFGDMDIMLKVIAPDMNWYQKFIFNTLLKLPGVEDIRSTITLGEIKSATALPVRLLRPR